ncbi:MAG: iron uptake porin [Merismopedia sp. SIO2A8]|nr:iron uptake porin [Merismopedia sp. SIO2A8]
MAMPSAIAQEITPVNALDINTLESSNSSMSQVTSVSQLSDVQPTDWAFQALQSLVERYGCIAGYPDGTYRGNRALTRYEFAAGLNACLDRVNELLAAGLADKVSRDDLAVLERLQEEFAAELATLRGRVDALEARVAEVEANQFSTTTKLQGEVAFTVANAFGEDVDSEVTFTDRVRLQLLTSFTGRDRLITRLTAGNVGNSFVDEIGTNEGRLAYDGQTDNDITLDRLHYVFPVFDDLEATVMASLGGHHFYAETFNPGLEAGGGANGALSRFGERNPIYRLGLGGRGVGFNYTPNDTFEVSAGYIAKGAQNPEEGAGLFNGNYSAMGQLVVRPTDSIDVGLTYVHSYDVSQSAFAFGGTGTGLGNLNVTSLGVDDTPVSSNSYGAAARFQITDGFDFRAWGSYTDATLLGRGGADIWTYAGALAFPNLFDEGSMGAIIAGASPYLTGLDVPGDPNFDNDVPLHIEAMYRYQMTDNISITPGLIWLTAPGQDSDNDDAVIGVVRTTFKF